MLSVSHDGGHIKRTTIPIAILAFAILCYAGCGLLSMLGSDETVDGLSETLLTFPESLSRPRAEVTALSAAVRAIPMAETTPTEVIDYVDYVHRPVRDTFNPIAEAAIEFTRSILDSLETNVFSNGQLMAVIERNESWSGYNGDSTEAYRVSRSDSIYTAEIWDFVSGEWLKSLHVTFSASGGGYRGTVVVRNTDVDAAENELYRIEFDANDPVLGQVTEVRAANLRDDDVTSTNIERKLWVQAFESEGTFYVNANVYFERIDIEEHSPYRDYFLDVLENDDSTSTLPDNLTGSYIYQGIASTTEDRGAVSLSLVPTNVTSTDGGVIFAEWSYGALYQRTISDWIRDGAYVDDAQTNTVIDAVNQILTAAGRDSAEHIGTGSTDAEIFTALESVYDILDADPNQDTSELAAVLFVVQVVNPGYYTSAGFMGTVALATPEWASDLADAQDDFRGEIEVSASDIASSDFESGVEMPAPAIPDF